MASSSSNSFSVGIVTPAAGTSVPTVQDERDTYTRWGWTWTESTANPAYNSVAGTGYVITNPDIHGDTEGDDVWSYVQAYARRTAGRDGYLQRARGWRDYYVNSFAAGRPEYNNDANFLFDHFYGWGLQQYGTIFNDQPAKDKALAIAMDIRNFWATGGRLGNGNWPSANGSFDIAHYGHRGPARNLRLAVEVADATSNALIVELRDRLIDLWLNSPDWDPVQGMYWVASDQMGFYNVSPPLSFAAGDRAASSFHIALVCEAFFRAYLSPNVSAQRKTDLRARIVAMATWIRAKGLDATYRYAGDIYGVKGNGANWHNYSLENPNTTSWDPFYTTSQVNPLVMGYKFTGDPTFLDTTPANGLYPAKYCFNRGTKGIFGSTTQRETGDNQVAHFVDTRFDTSTRTGSVPEGVYLYNNKGELQYTYLIFENGGAPSLL